MLLWFAFPGLVGTAVPITITLTSGSFSAEKTGGSLANIATLTNAGDSLQLLYVASGAVTNVWVVVGRNGATFS